MNSCTKRIRHSVDRLSSGEKTLETLYRIIFDHKDLVMAESATMTRKVSYTYAQTEAVINTVSASLSQTIGVSDRFIGLYGENSFAWIVLFWAILKSGNKPYLINLRQPQSFTQKMLQSLDAVCVVSVGDAPAYQLPSYSFDMLERQDGVQTDPVTVPFGNEIALSTSGTTLQEKICFYTGAELSNQILNITEIQKRNSEIVTPGSDGQIKQLVFLPLYHIFGLEAVYLWYTFFGSTFVFLPDYSPTSILRTARNHRVTHLFAVPLLWHAVEKNLQKQLSSMDEKTKRKFEKGIAVSLRLQNRFPVLGRRIAAVLFRDVRGKLFGDTLRFCISGGSFLHPSALKLLNALGYPLSIGYGMTEIGISSVELGKRPIDRMKGAIGIPFPSVDYRISEDGQLQVRGSSLCYCMQIGDTIQSLSDKWFSTGDRMHSDDDGRFYMEGRVSEIVFGDDGENLNPDFAERAFHALPYVQQYSVIGCRENSRLLLIVRVPEGLLAGQLRKLKEAIFDCNETLPFSYRVPEIRYTYDPLMEEGAIKVSRPALQKSLEEGKVNLMAFSPENNQIEENVGEIRKVLRQIFAEVLGKNPEEISDHAHFLNDLGGSSLDYFTLISEIDRRFEITLDFESGHVGYCLSDFEENIKELIH